MANGSSPAPPPPPGGSMFVMLMFMILMTVLRGAFFIPVFCVTVVFNSLKLCGQYVIYGPEAVNKFSSSFDTAWSDAFFKLYLKMPGVKALCGQSVLAQVIRSVVALVLLPMVYVTAIVPSCLCLVANLLYFVYEFPTDGFLPSLYGKWLEIYDKVRCTACVRVLNAGPNLRCLSVASRCALSRYRITSQ